jgi:hypothetical protein
VLSSIRQRKPCVHESSASANKNRGHRVKHALGRTTEHEKVDL